MTLDEILMVWLDRINLVVNDFVKTIDIDYHSKTGLDFYADLTDNAVVWSIVYADEAGEAFYNNFIKRYPIAKELSYFTLSILHEIGHLETEWEMVDDIEERNSNLTNEQYFNLYNEKIATDWAGTWIEDNFSAARIVDKKLNKILNQFYKEVLD